MAKKDDLDTKVSRDDVAYARKFRHKRSFKRWFVFIAIIIASTYLFYGWLYQNTATVRFKVIAVLEVDGEVKEFSNVMQVEYTRYDQASGLGYGGSSKTWGEALVIDLGERGRAYLLPSYFNRSGKSFTGLYDYSLLRTFEIDASQGSLETQHINQLNNLTGRRELITRGTNYGVDLTFVAFEDEKDPNSIYEIIQSDFHKYFGDDVKLVRVDVQVTDEDVTMNNLSRYLVWLNTKDDAFIFERAPKPTPLRKDWKLKWAIRKDHFIYDVGEK